MLAGAGGSLSKMVLPHGCWHEASVLCHMDLSTGLFEHPHSEAAGFPLVSDFRKNKTEAAVSFRA